MRELIIDNFAGGGGASTGIEMAIGRSPDYAINHDLEAVAMHAANHPETEHLSRNIWHVDPLDVVGRRPVGLAWFSPDCKHFSKAKGGRPVKRNIRDLAWTVVLWAKRVRPRVIILENVEEFRDWGPLLMRDDGQWMPCRDRRGETFKRWVGELRRLGYRLEYRELRACDYGAPTIRKRLVLIARRDGRKIVWPEPTHGAPNDPDVIAGIKQPWRTAADIIDWTLPCHSIFLSRAEGRAVGVNRPLADATMARIAKGVKKYVIDAAKPFLVPVTHQGDARIYDVDQPLRTITTAQRGEHAYVAPIVVRTAHGDQDRNGKKRGKGSHEISAPLGTVTASQDFAFGAVHLTKFSENSIGQRPDEPLHTVMPGAPRHGIVAAFIAQHNLGVVGRDARVPVSTIMSRGTQQAVVTAGLLNMKGAKRSFVPTETPLHTITAGAVHAAEVRAFLVKYYGSGGQDQRCDEPLHTVPTVDRFGLVMIDGQPFRIIDIGMRMLSTRELFRAQGFPDSYIIDHGIGQDGERIKLTKTAAIRMCGNSVCPPLAAAVVRANYSEAVQSVDVAGDLQAIA